MGPTQCHLSKYKAIQATVTFYETMSVFDDRKLRIAMYGDHGE
jgi:hypothetical protein